MKPFQASKEVIEKKVFDNLKENREKNIPKVKLRQLVRTADN